MKDDVEIKEKHGNFNIFVVALPPHLYKQIEGGGECIMIVINEWERKEDK